MAISEIVPLVIHTLSMAHELESLLVDGHEILTYVDGTESLAAFDDLQLYLSQSQSIDNYLEQQFRRTSNASV